MKWFIKEFIKEYILILRDWKVIQEDNIDISISILDSNPDVIVALAKDWEWWYRVIELN